MDSEKAAKLLRLAGSTNDHEALAALRKLQQLAGNWNEFVNGISFGSGAPRTAGIQAGRRWSSARQDSTAGTTAGTTADSIAEAMRRACERFAQHDSFYDDLLKGEWQSFGGFDPGGAKGKAYEENSSRMDRLQEEAERQNRAAAAARDEAEKLQKEQFRQEEAAKTWAWNGGIFVKFSPD